MEGFSPIPDTITITEYHFLDIKSEGADVECSVSSAMSQAPYPKILAQLKSSLKEAGIAESAFNITNLKRDYEVFGCLTAIVVLGVIAGCAHANSIGSDLWRVCPALMIGGAVVVALAWIFGRRTTCTFKIRCNDNDSVGRVHKLLAEQYGKVNVYSTSWRYDVQSDALANWADKCVERANARAQRVAKGLGVQIIGVFSYEEKHELPARHYTPEEIIGAPRKARASGHRKDAGPDLNVISSGGESRAGAHVRVQYKVANYVAPARS